MQTKEISVIEIALTQSADVNAVVKSIRQELPHASVTPIEQAVKYREKAMGSLAGFGLAITAAILFISGFIVFFIMSSSVSDRRREIGILRAIGYRQSSVIRIILTESFIQSTIAGAIGYIFGFGLSYCLHRIAGMADFIVNVNFTVLLISLAMAITVGMVASMPAVIKAVKISPAEAVKDV